MNKILHIITRLDMGGSAQNTLLTCLNLSAKYNLVLVYGLSRESGMTAAEMQSVEKNVARAKMQGVRCVALPSLVRKINPFQDICAFVALCKLIRREKPDIVHTHTSKAGLLGRWAAWMNGVQHIVHTPHGHVFYGHFKAGATKLFLIIERLTTPVTDRIVALTNGEKEDYIRLSVAKPAQIDTIHSGVDIKRYMVPLQNADQKKRSLGLDPANLVVGTVGWLLPIKAPMHLLDAMVNVWRQRANVDLVFVGKGDLEAALKQHALNMGVSQKVKFLGWRDDVHEIIPVFDLFVLPSLNEGMGRVLVEAMAAGKPVVASKAGGIPDLVNHGKNGLLVAPGNVEALADAIEKLLSDPSLRDAMGKEGRVLAPNFTEKRMIQKIDGLYAALLGT